MRSAALALLAAWLALPAAGQGIEYRGPSGGTTADPLSLADITGTTSNCGGAASGSANSVCLSANTLTAEGATANAFQTLLAFGDATADNGLTFTGTSTGVTIAAATGAVHIPSTTAGALSLGTNTTNPYLASYYSGITGGIKFGRDGVAGTGLLFADNSHLTVSNINGRIILTPAAATGPTVTTLALTSATMANETSTQLRGVTSSYTWTNAQVVALGAALTGDINVATLPAKTQVLDALVVITGAAAGPTTVTVSCGDAIGGTPFINYVVPSDAKAAANTVYGDAVAERGASLDTEFWYLPSYTATTLVTCHWIATDANLDQVTGSTGRVILTTRLLP